MASRPRMRSQDSFRTGLSCLDGAGVLPDTRGPFETKGQADASTILGGLGVEESPPYATPAHRTGS